MVAPEHRALDAALRDYFAGEKQAAWAWLGVGLLAAGASSGLGAAPSDAAQGASFPLIDIAVIQLGGALWLLWHNDDQLARLQTQLADDPCAFFADEPARIRRAKLRYSIAIPIEATTLVGGAAMAGLGFTNKHDFVAGAGLGLVAQSLILIVFDQFAKGRADAYGAQLEHARASSGCR